MKNWNGNTKLAAIMLSTLVLTSACGATESGDDPTVSGDDTTTPVTERSAEQTFTDTIVVLRPDGTSSVRSVQVTQAQRDAELGARAEREALRAGNDASILLGAHPGEQNGEAAAALTADGSCAGADLWLFDQASRAGNRLCLAGTGTASLGAYCRTQATICWAPGNCNTFCTSNWLTSVRSFWSGSQVGIYSSENDGTFMCGPLTCDPGFLTYAIHDSTTTCESAARFVHLGDDACIPLF